MLVRRLLFHRVLEPLMKKLLTIFGLALLSTFLLSAHVRAQDSNAGTSLFQFDNQPDQNAFQNGKDAAPDNLDCLDRACRLLHDGNPDVYREYLRLLDKVSEAARIEQKLESDEYWAGKNPKKYSSVVAQDEKQLKEEMQNNHLVFVHSTEAN